MKPRDEFATVVLETMSDGVYTVDRERRITYWSPGAERLTGYRADDVVGHLCRANILNHVDTSGRPMCTDRCPLEGTMSDGLRREAHAYLHHREGHRVPVAVRAAALRDPLTGAIQGAVEVFNDDASCARLGEQLSTAQRAAHIDPLTDLPNRRLITARLSAAHDDFVRAGHGLAVLFVDVDRFKGVNDTYGHAAGDRVLTMIGATLRSCTRSTDLVGRWGGEEFVVVVADAGPELVCLLAERLRAMVGQSWVDVAGRRIRVSVSVGAALAQAEESVDELVGRADLAMLSAKADGRDRVRLATPWPSRSGTAVGACR